MELLASYLNFARKYRPRNFSELVGQEVLTKILSQSIINNRLAPGYLLSGTRGVGKTTSARIIAQTINCTSPIIKDISINPCEDCANCQSCTKRRHPDILEIDAASKTGVDDIRDIIESSEYRPLLGRYKVFIIDEVHMLSKSAFNALLKVLEEPPAHILFIFATTEIQKIPPTIISRCQRYDLRRLSSNEIFELVKNIAQKEQILIDSEALYLIALKSEGSAREGVALLDQVVNFNFNNKENIITAAMVSQMIGIADIGTIIDLYNAIINNDCMQAIATINRVYQQSVTLENLFEDLTDFIAYLNKSISVPNFQDMKYVSFQEKIDKILEKSTLSKLSILWQIFYKANAEIRTSYNPLMICEMTIIKAIYSYSLPPIEELVNSYPDDNKIPNNSSMDSGNKRTISLSNSNIDQNNQIIPKYQKKPEFVDFLIYLQTHNEMEIYYSLLNNFELKKLEHNFIELATENIDIKFKNRIESQLSSWLNRKWEVAITKSSSITSLKNQLASNLQSANNWELIKSSFPSASISDIILKVK